ncbi:MAG: hypothetical protein JHC25_01245, partial [Thermodesulfobacterium sp.]|nr:hypothetical protein [Thermodesulfobacterium sp.]
YLSTIEPYRELSPKARKVLFEKVEPLWEKLKKEYEEILKLEQEVLELAKKILSDPRYVFHSWRKLREDLWRIGRMDHWRIYGNEGRIEEILSRNADILMEIYRKFPEPTTDSLSDEEILKVAENVKEEKDKWVRRGKIREEVERLLETKGLRIVPAVVEEAIKKVEKLIEEETETKETRETKIDWAEIEKIEKQIKEETPEEKWEELKRQFEASKEQRKEEKKAKEEEGALPDPEELYRQKLRTLLMDMGLKLGWVKAFQIAEEVYEEVREYAKRSVRGW